MVRGIGGAEINPLKIRVRKICGGGNYASKYGVTNYNTMDLDLQHNYCLMTSTANKIAGSCSWQQ